MKLGMIIDKRRCYGCLACVAACKTANATPPKTYWTKTTYNESGKFPNSRMEYMPQLCNHCDEAPCVKVCPSGASMKMEDGTVQVDQDKCIGCESCIAVCPYEARYLNSEKSPTYWDEKDGQDPLEAFRSKEHKLNTVGKCTFCAPRRAQGLAPACVETCGGVARIFGDLDDPNSKISKLMKKENPQPLHPEYGTKPRVFYIESEKTKA